MSTPEIAGFVVDDENDDKCWAHGVRIEHVIEVLEAPYRLLRNRKERRAPYLVIGRDHQGRCLAIPIEPTYDPGLWRPVTAWWCKPSEASRCP